MPPSQCFRNNFAGSRMCFTIVWLFTCLVFFFNGYGFAQATEALDVKEISPGVFVAQAGIAEAGPGNLGHIANIGFIIGETAVAAIDTGGSRAVGERLRTAIRKHTHLPVKYVINTHMHPDHVLGNAAFSDDKPVFVGHEKLATALEVRAETYLEANQRLIGATAFAGTKIITPSLTVKTVLQLDLGGRKLLLKAFATAHTDNDLIVVDLKTRTAWLGDLLFREHLPVIDGALNGWLEALAQIARADYALVVPGHGEVSRDWPGVMTPQRDYLRNLRREVRRFIAEGRDLNEALENIPLTAIDDWKLGALFHRRNISAAFAELEWE